MPSALLTLGFASVLAAGVLLTSSLRGRSIGEVLKGITSPNVASAQAALGAEVPPEEPATNTKGGGRFVAGPGTNYTAGKEPEIVRRLSQLGSSIGATLRGISGYRSPAHSVAVGGFPNDPHTKGEASDTEGTQKIPKRILNKFGLERPFPGAAEADHIQLLHSATAFGGY